jgi:hypothetical protein
MNWITSRSVSAVAPSCSARIVLIRSPRGCARRSRASFFIATRNSSTGCMLRHSHSRCSRLGPVAIEMV